MIAHGIDLFAEQWADSEDIPADQATRTVIRKMYADEIDREGTFDKLTLWCQVKVTDRTDYTCAMAAKRPDDFMRCLPVDDSTLK